MITNMLDYVRFALYAILIVIVILFYQLWDKEHQKPVTNAPAETVSSSYIPEVTAPTEKTTSASQTAAPTSTSNPIATTSSHIIHVNTDVFEVDIDTLGGNISQVKLKQYPESLNSKTPFVLLNNNPATRYIAQSGLLSTKGPDTSKGQALYTSEKTDYTLNPGQEFLIVSLQWQNEQGLKVTKNFVFKPNDYEIGMDYQITNNSKQAWEGNLYTQIMRKDAPPVTGSGLANFATYFGAAISSPQKPFEKISFKDMTKQNVNQTITGGWEAMVQHYFVSAWVPDKNTTSQYFSRVTPDGLYTIGSIGPSIAVTPGATFDTATKFYAGPAIADKLKKVAPGLDLTIDYGWFWFISVIIFWMMQKIHSVVGNWGWSIVLVTVVIKLMFYHLSAKSYRSMSAMKKIQPKINALKERFGDDKQKFTQATLELYKKEKVNPMSGCLPILIQIPVFIALYWVLIESVDLRQAPFILWIHDLSTKDPYYVLPILMGISMLVQQRLSPPPPDPMQAKVMMFMPVVFTVLFVNFPAGLMLYWFVNNSLSVLQQWFIMRSMDKAEKSKKPK
ncbi:MAG: membrane protein insertase YidC [Gammaproteobacteria bacterium]